MSISFPATQTGHDAGDGSCWVIGLEPLDASESPERPLADLLAQMARQLRDHLTRLGQRDAHVDSREKVLEKAAA
jgi:hypothetical protein